MWQAYHKRFPDVTTLTSTEYLSSKYTLRPSSTSKYILVDVRSKAEQDVSMIPTAVTLSAFEKKMKISPQSNTTITDEIVVTYCTIGFRSGLEARRLRDKYNLNVMNLDGIVSYTHACSVIQDPGAKDTSTSSLEENVYLIDPKTKKATKRVHVFGPVWNVASNAVEATYFSTFSMALRGLSVAFFAFVQSVKGFLVTCICGSGKKRDTI